MATNPLTIHFHRGEKQNSTHYHTCCKGCVDRFKMTAALTETADDDGNLTLELTERTRSFKDGG